VRERPTCTVTGCSEPHRGRGYCKSHYEKFRRWGDPEGSIEKAQAIKQEYVIGEIEWFIQFGISPEITAAQLGYQKMSSLNVLLNRWNRPDLAEYFIHRQEENWFRQWLGGKHRSAA
jgi:hypothetical protein